MQIVKGVGGALLLLIGLVWIGQGLNLVLGSPMSGKPVFSGLGLVVALLGLWLLWMAVQDNRRAGGQPR